VAKREEPGNLCFGRLTKLKKKRIRKGDPSAEIPLKNTEGEIDGRKLASSHRTPKGVGGLFVRAKDALVNLAWGRKGEKVNKKRFDSDAVSTRTRAKEEERKLD